jgi:hypothetical protein
MPRRRRLPLSLLAITLTLGLWGAGCLFSPKEGDPPIEPPPPIPPPTSPENLVKALEVIYNDKVRSASERLLAYDSLFSRDFIFRFQAVDIANGLPPSWGISEELESALGMFTAQDESRIYSLILSITHAQAQDLYPPVEGREGWKEVFATNIYLKLLNNPDDGFEVNGGQGEYQMSQVRPPTGRWYIREWIDLPRP